MESLVLGYDKEEGIAYVKVFPTFSTTKYFDVSKIDEYRYVEEISWKEFDKKSVLPEAGDTIVLRYTSDTGNIVLKYLIKQDSSVYRCIRINQTMYLIFCGKDIEEENQE